MLSGGPSTTSSTCKVHVLKYQSSKNTWDIGNNIIVKEMHPNIYGNKRHLTDLWFALALFTPMALSDRFNASFSEQMSNFIIT